MTMASLAPVYRYYTADLLTNEILSEIPFRGVSYERAIKGAGGFSGSIPVIADTKTLNLYESTMPGKTALYVVRDGVCVWGGILWSRSYNVVDRVLQVSASEFTSYFYHRRIWKTWSHQYGATITVANGVATAVLDNGSSTSLTPAATVRLDFNEMSEYRYNGFYVVADTPTPTLDQFSISDSESIATVLSVRKDSKVVSIQTEGPHGFSTGDRITLDLGSSWGTLNGTYSITAVGGSESEEFTFSQSGGDIKYAPVSGSATRPLPDGVYVDVTVSVRADTYDYIRSLVTSVFKDFVGIDFPNVYIEPGISYPFDITEKALDNGIASIKTSEPHNLAVGQAVQIVDLGNSFDGEYQVLETRADDRFTYAKGGSLAPTAVSVISEDINKVSALSGVVTISTVDPHGIKVGQNVTVTTGIDFGDVGPFLNGTYKVTSVPTSTTFRYASGVSTLVIPPTTLVDATATLLTPASRINLITNPTFGVSTAGYQGVGGATIPFLTRVTTQSYYGPSSMAVLCTSTTALQGAKTSPQAVQAGGAYNGSMYIQGVQGTKFVLTIREYNSAGTLIGSTASEVLTLTSGWKRVYASRQLTNAAATIDLLIQYLTPTPYTFYVDAVMLTESGALFDYFDGDTSDDVGGLFAWTGTAHASTSVRRTVAQVIRRAISSNKVTLTTAEPSGCVVGQSVLVAGVTPSIAITEKSFEATRGRATISTKAPHELAVGDTVTVSGLSDSSDLAYRAVAGNVVTFTTRLSHNLSVGKTVSITGLRDVCTIKSRSLANNLVTVQMSPAHNIAPNTEVDISGIYEVIPITGEFLYNNVAVVTLAENHNFAVNDEIAIAGLLDSAQIISKSAENGIAIITLSKPHNFLETEKIKISGLGAPFDGTVTILSTTNTRVLYEIKTKGLIPVTAAAGTLKGTTSIFNGEFVISAVGKNTVSFQRAGNDVTPRFSTGGVLTAESPYNGTYTCYDAPNSTSIRYAWNGNSVPSRTVPVPSASGQLPAQISIESIHTGDRVVTAITRNTFKFNQTVTRAVAYQPLAEGGSVTVASIFNGTKTITTATDTTFEYALTAPSNVLETPANSLAYIRAAGIYNGTYTVTEVNSSTNSFSYSRVHGDMASAPVYGYGSAVVRPSTVVSSFGPFPGNADIGIGFSTNKYSGINVQPTAFRGFELKNVGEALAAYSDSIQGFEYRIDCAYDHVARAFTRTFVLIPIDFPDPPAAGEVSPLSRFGADKLVFEYPGNIISMELEESAENSATRFFAVGETDLGPGAGPSFGVASSEELLRGEDGRRWPLLDEDAQIKDTDDEAVLYSYAQRYLNENRPPDAKLSVTVNGSLQPEIGTYAPGDWCSLIVDDEFLRQRLASDLEPRDTVIVRKIDSMKITVPDGTTFPEKVSLTLVPEWEVDKRGE